MQPKKEVVSVAGEPASMSATGWFWDRGGSLEEEGITGIGPLGRRAVNFRETLEDAGRGQISSGALS